MPLTIDCAADVSPELSNIKFVCTRTNNTMRNVNIQHTNKTKKQTQQRAERTQEKATVKLSSRSEVRTANMAHIDTNCAYCVCAHKHSDRAKDNDKKNKNKTYKQKEPERERVANGVEHVVHTASRGTA